MPTGGYEWGATYTTQKQNSFTNLEQQTYLAAVRATNGSGAIDQPVATLLPLPLFVGQGAPLNVADSGRFRCARCRPTCCRRVLEPSRSTEPRQARKRLIYGQILSFARTISALDAAPANAF